MSIRVDSTSWIAGAVVVGDPGLGVPAEAVPSTGEHGAGYAYAALAFPADAGKEVCGRVTSWPVSGTLTTYEDTSFEYDGPSFSTMYQLYLDGVAVGSPQTFSVTLESNPVLVGPGTSGVVATGYAATVTYSGANSVAPGAGQVVASGYLPTIVQPNVQPAGNCRLYVKRGGVYQLLTLH